MKIFMFNHTGSLNHGCEAIIRGTVNVIENSRPDCSFLLSSYNPESDSAIKKIEVCQFNPRSLTFAEKAIAKVSHEINGSEKYALKKMYDNVVKQAQDCDICLSVGGDTYCYGDNSQIQVVTEELKKSGKKVFLWGASIGEEDLSEAKLENLKTFDAVFTRESLTYNLLKEKKANENLFLFSDPAFCMEREETPVPDGFDRSNSIGLNISPLIAKSNPKIFDAADGFVSYLIENTTLNVLLVPHVVEKNNNDYEFMLPIAEKYADTGRVKILPDTYNAKQYKGCISNLRFFIGARTHATIAAYSSGVPTFVIGYSVKSKGIATDLFGDDRYVADSSKIESTAQLADMFNILLRDENEIRETLKLKIPFQMRNAMRMGEKLFNI